MRYIVQAVFALAVLIGLPVFVKAPASLEGMIAATVGALILLAIAIHGVVGYVRSSKPKSYHDSIMPTKHFDMERTVIKPPKKDPTNAPP